MKTSGKRIQSYKEFYAFYLREHSNAVNRAFHFAGTLLVQVLLATVLIQPSCWLILLVPVAGYGFAWAGHFLFEKNKPATFRYPLWSLASDFVMFFHIISGDIESKLQEAQEKHLSFSNVHKTNEDCQKENFHSEKN